MKTRTVVIISAGGCGLLLIATLIACAGSLLFSFRAMDGQVSPTVDAFFQSIDDGTFPQRYESQTSPEFRKAMGREEYLALGKTIQTGLGEFKKKSLRQMNFRSSTGGTFAIAVYTANFERGDATVTATLKKQDDGWVISGINIQSPVFLQSLPSGTCPECEEPYTANAEFCSKCGARLRVAKDDGGGESTDN